MELRWGLTLPFAGLPLAAHEPLVRRAEAAGYDDLWTGETNGPDGSTPSAVGAARSKRARLGTRVVNPFTRGPGGFKLQTPPEQPLRGIFIFGGPDAMKQRHHAFAERGITTLVLTPIGADLIDEPAP